MKLMYYLKFFKTIVFIAKNLKNGIIFLISKEEKVLEKNNMLKKALNKISICLYIIIGLLAIILVIQIANGNVVKDTKTNNKSEETAETSYDVSVFNAIDATKFMSLLNGKEASIIYFGRETCGYCVQFLPVLQKAQTNIGYQTHYFDITKGDTKNEDFKSMLKVYDGMLETYNKKNNTDYKELYGFTPAVLIVQNGKIKDIWIGYGSYETYTGWLSDNGIK